MPLFLGNGTPTSVFAFLVIGMALMGMTFGPMAALLPELFPTEVRYSGASLALQHCIHYRGNYCSNDFIKNQCALWL